MAGTSPHRSRQKMQRTTVAGAMLMQQSRRAAFDPTCHDERFGWQEQARIAADKKCREHHWREQF